MWGIVEWVVEVVVQYQKRVRRRVTYITEKGDKVLLERNAGVTNVAPQLNRHERRTVKHPVLSVPSNDLAAHVTLFPYLTLCPVRLTSS